MRTISSEKKPFTLDELKQSRPSSWNEEYEAGWHDAITAMENALRKRIEDLEDRMERESGKIGAGYGDKHYFDELSARTGELERLLSEDSVEKSGEQQ